MTQTIQAPAPASIVVGFSDDVPAWLLRQVNFLDSGNGAGLALAVTLANSIVASAQNPGCKILILRGTIDLDAAGAPTTPYSLSAGVTIEGESTAAGTATGAGVQIRGRSSGNQGIFTSGGARVTLRHLELSVRKPTAGTSGSTAVVSLAGAGSFVEDVLVTLEGTLDGTETGNLTLRTAVSLGGGSHRLVVNGLGWKIRQFVASDFVLLSVPNAIHPTALTTHEATRLVGGDITCSLLSSLPGVNFVACTFKGAYRYLVSWIGGFTSAGTLFTSCVFDGADDANLLAGLLCDPAATGQHGPCLVNCEFQGANGATDVAIDLLSTSGRTILLTSIVGCRFSNWGVAIQIGANATGTTIIDPVFVGTVATAISDAGINTIGKGAGMTWRGTFTAGAGATTAYAGMGEAAAEMGAGNAQKRFPAFGGVAFRLRVHVISNSMPASTVFTVMQDTGATALAVTVGAGATGQFVSSGSIVFAAVAAASFQTWDLRAVETGVGTIVFSATLELI